MKPLTELETAAVEAHFALGYITDDVRRDPHAPGAEQRLAAAAEGARRAAEAAGVADLEPSQWLLLIARHPGYLLWAMSRETAAAQTAADNAALAELERAVRDGDRLAVLRCLTVLLPDTDTTGDDPR